MELNKLKVNMPCLNHQHDDHSCGLWAIIYFLLLWVGKDPACYSIKFNQKLFRKKLVEFLDENITIYNLLECLFLEKWACTIQYVNV